MYKRQELYVSGEAYGCGGCTIAVIAAGCDVENIREEDIAYVGYAEVIDNSFSQRIDLSDSPGGEYRILIGSERLEEVYESCLLYTSRCV